MKVVLFGATGMVGRAALRESLLATDVDEVVSVVRRASGVQHPKLREVTLTDFTDLGPIAADLAGADACLYCIGVQSGGLDEAAYTRVTYDFPVAAARALVAINPDVTFVYVTGAGTDAAGRQLWQRVKGRAENAVIEIVRNGYAVRPFVIRPVNGERSSVGWWNTVYTVTGPLLKLLDRWAPAYVTSTDRLGRAMLDLARHHPEVHIRANRDLR